MFSRTANSQRFRQNIFLKIYHYKRLPYSQEMLMSQKKVLVISNTEYATCGGGSKSGGSKHRISYKPYVAPCFEDHDHKNMRLNRPMSPHLAIYAPTLPAMTSIVERITGTILSFYTLMLSAGTLFLSNGIDTYVSVIQSLNLSSPLIFIIKLIAGFPFLYHYFIGIRFSAWNAGKWLAMSDVYGTANKCFILTAIFTVLFALR